MSNWLLLVLTLPTANTAVRMRAWRGLKASGAAVLRDGAYLLPAGAAGRAVFSEAAGEIRAGGGDAWLLEVGGDETDRFAALFDRTPGYARLHEAILAGRRALTSTSAPAVLREARKLRKGFMRIAMTDFFPGEARRQVATALDELENAAQRLTAPDEPEAAAGPVPRADAAACRGRVWATRRRPWVDRLASAWLIRRHIDPAARFVWLAHPADCPADALGFDFDGARFSHVGSRVTFETLLAAFDLNDPALARLGAIVHYLDAGGVALAEAAGVARVLKGLCAAHKDDDRLLDAACGVLDALAAAFAHEEIPS